MKNKREKSRKAGEMDSLTDKKQKESITIKYFFFHKMFIGNND